MLPSLSHSTRSLLTAGLFAALFSGCFQPDDRQLDTETTTLPVAAVTGGGYCEGLTLTGTVTASSVENASYPASAAMDQKKYTRWSSQYSDPQWIRVDFGSARTITTVAIWWEHANSKDYTLQVSNDGANWTTVRTITFGMQGAGYVRHTALNTQGRYLRLHSTARNTPYGISILEMEVFGDVTTCTQGLSCGDGQVVPYEVCDDGNNRFGDGCAHNCKSTTASHKIINFNSLKALDVPNGSTANGARAQQWAYLNGTNQQWDIEGTSHLYGQSFPLRNRQSGKCLEVVGASMADGAELQQNDCNGSDNQRFHLSYQVNGTQLRSLVSGKCVEVKNASLADGTLLRQWACGMGSGVLHQKWDFQLLNP